MDMMKKSTATATTISCEIVRLPVDIISALIARTGPRDACRVAVVSPAFHTAADSDVVWNCFLPSNLPLSALGELSPPPTSKKALFMRLSNGPVLLADGLTSIWLNKETGAMCYMLSAKKLSIYWNGTPTYYCRIPTAGSRIFSDAAGIWRGSRMEIHGKIDSGMLSKHTKYTAYILLAVDEYDRCCCSFGPCHKTLVTISLGGSTSTREVVLDTHDLRHQHSWQARRGALLAHGDPSRQRFCTQWKCMELELGDFYNGEGEDGEVSISLVDTSLRRSGLFVLGIGIIANGQEA